MFLAMILLAVFSFALLWITGGLKEAQREANEDYLIGGGVMIFIFLFGSVAIMFLLYSMSEYFIDYEQLRKEKKYIMVAILNFPIILLSFKISYYIIYKIVFGDKKNEKNQLKNFEKQTTVANKKNNEEVENLNYEDINKKPPHQQGAFTRDSLHQALLKWRHSVLVADGEKARVPTDDELILISDISPLSTIEVRELLKTTLPEKYVNAIVLIVNRKKTLPDISEIE